MGARLVDAIQPYDKVRESSHETLDGLRDRVLSNGRRYVVYRQRSVFAEK
jgi:hypothetical protein